MACVVLVLVRRRALQVLIVYRKHAGGWWSGGPGLQVKYHYRYQQLSVCSLQEAGTTLKWQADRVGKRVGTNGLNPTSIGRCAVLCCAVLCTYGLGWAGFYLGRLARGKMQHDGRA